MSISPWNLKPRQALRNHLPQSFMNLETKAPKGVLVQVPTLFLGPGKKFTDKFSTSMFSI